MEEIIWVVVFVAVIYGLDKLQQKIWKKFCEEIAKDDEVKEMKKPGF